MKTLDVGCGAQPKGDVNIDLHVGYTLQGGDQRKVGIFIDPKRIPNFIRADAQYLPFKDRSFEKVISHHVIEHVEEPFKMLSEMSRVTNCRIEIVCPHWLGIVAKMPSHLHYFDGTWFHKALRKLGFKSVDINYTGVDYLHEVPITRVLTKLRIRSKQSTGGYYPLYLLFKKLVREKFARCLSLHVKFFERPYALVVKGSKL